MPDVNLNPYSAEQSAIEQRRKMAEMLMQQSQTPMDTNQMAGGYVVPVSPLAGLAKMLQAYGGAKGRDDANAQSKALAERYSGDQMGDMTQLARMLAAPGQAATPERPAMQDPQEIAQQADYGTPAPQPIAAQPAKAAGQIDPEQIGQFRTTEGQNMALAQLLAQVAPKDGVVLPDGASLVSKTGKILVEGTKRPEFGTTPHYETKDGKTYAVYSDKQGNRKMVEATPQNQFTTGTVDANNSLAQKQYEFNNLSTAERARLENESRRLGISAAELFFTTGTGGGNAGAPLPPNAPMPNFAQPGQTPPPMQPSAPQAAQRAPQQPMAPSGRRSTIYGNATQPVAQPAANPLLTPKQQSELAMRRAETSSGNVQQASAVLALSKGAEELLNAAHGSGLGNIVGGVQNFFGVDSSKNQADAKLTALSGALVAQQPKMSGPQSDKDVLLYRQMAGDIGNAALPASVRKAALATVREIAEAYKDGFSSTGYEKRNPGSATPTVKPYADAATEAAYQEYKRNNSK